jgi:hypothetical protein
MPTIKHRALQAQITTFSEVAPFRYLRFADAQT